MNFPAESEIIIAERSKLAYVLNPKAGCTSVLLALASLEGENLERLYASQSLLLSREQTIHDSSLWTHLSKFSGDTIPNEFGVSEENGWLIFTIVRDPVRRLWSAWSDKILEQTPWYSRQYGAEEWFPSTTPTCIEDIANQFEIFVIALCQKPDLLRDDAHWRPQIFNVFPNSISYGFIGSTPTLDKDLKRIGRHAASKIPTATQFNPLHSNRGNLPLISEFLNPGVFHKIIDLYAQDFSELGIPLSLEPSTTSAFGNFLVNDSDNRYLNLMATLIERNQRLGDLGP